MTLGGAAAARVRFMVWCRKCRYQVEPATASLRAAEGGTSADPAAKLLTEPSQMASPAEMARRYGPETPVPTPEWHERLVCSRCGVTIPIWGDQRTTLRRLVMESMSGTTRRPDFSSPPEISEIPLRSGFQAQQPQQTISSRPLDDEPLSPHSLEQYYNGHHGEEWKN
jgi:hypothetical protein